MPRGAGPLHKKEIQLPFAGAEQTLPAQTPQFFALLSAGLFVLAPVAMAVMAIIKRSVDNVIIFHPVFIKTCVWTVSAAFALLAFASALLCRPRGYSVAFKAVKTMPVFNIFVLLVIIMIISQTVNGWGYYALYGAEVREETAFMQIGYFVLLFPAGALISDNGKKLWLIRLHLAVSLVLIVCAFTVWKAESRLAAVAEWRSCFSSIYSNTNYYGYYLSLTVPAAAASFVAEKHAAWKAFALFALAANGAALYINSTMGAWVACAFALAFIFATRYYIEKRFNFFVLTGVLVFAASMIITHFALRFAGAPEANANNVGKLVDDIGAIIADSGSASKAGSGRWGIWREVVLLIGKRPLLGYGIEALYTGGLSEIVHNTRPHNEFLQYALFYGIPAALLYVAGCAGVFLRGKRLRAKLHPASYICLAAAFGYLVSSFFGNTLFCTTPLFFLFLGMGYQRTVIGD
ncbi:MAG: O-antigen ligase family protein [Clostridia bacterium]|nr:O-antigen ligase family protein [Clostridia bacterium]